MMEAGMKGETKKIRFRVPHRELVPEDYEFEDIDLVITVETEWEQSDESNTGDFEES